MSAAGYDQRAINYDEIIALLRRDEEDEGHGGLGVQIRWEDLTREHVISYQGDDSANHIATYATLKFIEVGFGKGVGAFPRRGRAFRRDDAFDLERSWCPSLRWVVGLGGRGSRSFFQTFFLLRSRRPYSSRRANMKTDGKL